MIRTQQSRSACREGLLGYTTFAEVRTQTGIGPCEVGGGARSHVGVFVIDGFDELVALDLGVGAEVAVLDEPVADVAVGPGGPDCVGGGGVVVPVQCVRIKLYELWNGRGYVLDELDGLFTVDLLVALDVTVRYEPVLEFRVGPGRVDGVGEAVVVVLELLSVGGAFGVVGLGNEVVRQEPFALNCELGRM